LIGAAVLAVVLTAGGAGLLAQRTEADRAAAAQVPAGRGDPGRGPADVRGVLRAVDAAKHTLTIAVGEGREATVERTFAIAKDAAVFLDDGRARRFCACEGKLTDLAAGAVVTLRLSGDQKTVEALLAEGPVVRGTLTAVDAAKGTVTLSGPARRGEDALTETTYVLNKAVEVVLDDGRGRRTSLHEAKLGDLKVGCLVTLKLSPNQKEAVSVLTEGPNVQGTIKAVDAARQTITLAVRTDRGAEAGGEKTYAVAPGADVVVEDERPRRFFPVREVGLADLPVGAVAALKLLPDQSAAVVVRGEGPYVNGVLKAVDPGKGAVTVVVGGGRGEDGQEKTYSVAKDVRVFVEGAEGKFADLKVGDPLPSVILKLSVDQQSVRMVTVGRGR
jgi:hypothetical protein